MTIRIYIYDDTYELLEQAECLSFESAAEELGKMENRQKEREENLSKEQKEDLM